MENQMDEETWNIDAAQIERPSALEKRRVKVKRVRDTLILLGVLAFLLLVFNFSPYRFGMTVGNSMYPTMRSRHMFVMNVNPFVKSAPARWDVVVFEHDGDTVVKRVTGVSSDIIWLLVTDHDNEVIPKKAVNDFRDLIKKWNLHAMLKQIVVPKGSVFVQGDNSRNSEDSRDYGPVPISKIIGKVVYTENWAALNFLRKSQQS